MKALDTYTSISEYLFDNGFVPRSDGTGFSDNVKFIPVEAIAKHSVRTFDEFARKQGWIREKKEDEPAKSIYDAYGRLFGFAMDMAIMDD